MNSARIKNSLQRAWLRVDKVGQPRPGYSTLRGYLFDGTPFDFDLPDYDYDSESSLVEVALVGNVGNVTTSGILEIVLPAPSLHLGHNVRVSESSLMKYNEYELLMKIKKSQR